MRLIQEGRLTLGTSMQSVLNLRTPTGGLPTSPAWGSITIEHLLRMQSGVMSLPTHQAVAAAFGIGLPVTKAQTAAFAASQPLAFTPGSPPAGANTYSNMGYVLLGMVAERILGTAFLPALTARVLVPLGVSRVRRFDLLVGNQPATEARYDAEDLSVGPSVIHNDGRILSRVYGADFDPAVWESSGGLSIATPDFAKILACLNVRSGNPVLNATRIDQMLNMGLGFDGIASPPRRGWKTGGIWGTSAMIDFVENGFSIAVAYAKGGAPLDGNAIRNAVASTVWPAGDLFPSFGIPSF